MPFIIHENTNTNTFVVHIRSIRPYSMADTSTPPVRTATVVWRQQAQLSLTILYLFIYLTAGISLLFDLSLGHTLVSCLTTLYVTDIKSRAHIKKYCFSAKRKSPESILTYKINGEKSCAIQSTGLHIYTCIKWQKSSLQHTHVDSRAFHSIN